MDVCIHVVSSSAVVSHVGTDCRVVLVGSLACRLRLYLLWLALGWVLCCGVCLVCVWLCPQLLLFGVQPTEGFELRVKGER